MDSDEYYKVYRPILDECVSADGCLALVTSVRRNPVASQIDYSIESFGRRSKILGRNDRKRWQINGGIRSQLSWNIEGQVYMPKPFIGRFCYVSINDSYGLRETDWKDVDNLNEGRLGFGLFRAGGFELRLSLPMPFSKELLGQLSSSNRATEQSTLREMYEKCAEVPENPEAYRVMKENLETALVEVDDYRHEGRIDLVFHLFNFGPSQTLPGIKFDVGAISL